MNETVNLVVESSEDLSIHAKCYVSHESEIEMICHVCGRPMKPTSKRFHKKHPVHRKKLLRLLEQSRKQPKVRTIWNRWIKKLNPFMFRKFIDYELHPDEPVYCKLCAAQFYYRRIIYFFSIFSFGIAYLFKINNSSVLVKSLFILVLVLGSLLIFIAWIQLRNQQAPTFPILGRMPRISITEHIKGSIRLSSDGVYRGKVLGNGQGLIKVTSKLTAADRKNFGKFKKKYFARRVNQHAGFIVFHQKKELDFSRKVTLGEDFASILPLTKRLSSIGNLDMNLWENELEYHFSCIEQDKLPLQLIPNIISEGGNHTALELTLQIPPEDKRFVGAQASVNFLKLEDINAGASIRTFPPSISNSTEWKRILFVQDNAQVDEKGELVKNVENAEIIQKIKTYSRATFYVRFEAPVTQNTRIRGRLEITFDRLFSQLDNIQLFSSLGYEVDPMLMSIKKETRVRIDFFMDFQSLQIKVPFSKLAEVHAEKIPDHKLLNKLIDRLSERQDVYVQRVIENPPATNKATAMMLNRFWEISGRFYENGLFPVDFRILVTGKEKYKKGQEDPVCGNLHFEITVNATVIKDNSTGADKFFQELHEIVKQVKSDFE